MSSRPKEYVYHLDYQDDFECQRRATIDSAMCRIINYQQAMQPARVNAVLEQSMRGLWEICFVTAKGTVLNEHLRNENAAY